MHTDCSSNKSGEEWDFLIGNFFEERLRLCINGVAREFDLLISDSKKLEYSFRRACDR